MESDSILFFQPVVDVEGGSEDEPDASKCIGCVLTTALLVMQKRQRSLSDQEPRTAASQPAINRSWATSKAL